MQDTVYFMLKNKVKRFFPINAKTKFHKASNKTCVKGTLHALESHKVHYSKEHQYHTVSKEHQYHTVSQCQH